MVFFHSIFPRVDQRVLKNIVGFFLGGAIVVRISPLCLQQDPIVVVEVLPPLCFSEAASTLGAS